MKNKFLILAGLALLAIPLTKANAYSSNAGADPDRTNIGDGSSQNLGGDVETKGIKKTTDSGESEALIAGLVVGYDPGRADGYTVTRAVAQSTLGQNTVACVTTDEVATNDTNYHQCITKGFVRVRYNGGTVAITAGKMACVNASGIVVGCDYGLAFQATANTGIMPLETKSDSGTNLRAIINMR